MWMYLCVYFKLAGYVPSFMSLVVCFLLLLLLSLLLHLLPPLLLLFAAIAAAMLLLLKLCTNKNFCLALVLSYLVVVIKFDSIIN